MPDCLDTDTTFPTKGNLQPEHNPTSQQRIQAGERQRATSHCAGWDLGMGYWGRNHADKFPIPHLKSQPDEGQESTERLLAGFTFMG